MWNRYCKGIVVRGNTAYRDRITGASLSFLSSITCYPSGSMPGERCQDFLFCLQQAMLRKYESSSLFSAWMVPQSLYELWKCTSKVNTELFADCINESGVLSQYCSMDFMDVAFGSIGSWEHNEESVSGGAGNPPFDTCLIARLLEKVESGVQKTVPYCRCLVLPTGMRYGVQEHLQSIISEGLQLLSIPGGCFPFKDMHNLLSGNKRKAKPSLYQGVGLYIWRNREYLVQNPPPQDVLEVYRLWIVRTLHNPANVTLYEDAFEKAFPVKLRNEERMMPYFYEQVPLQ